MGGEQAASVLATVHRDADKAGRRSRPRRSRPRSATKYEDEGNPWHATARLWDDGIIDPAQTRDVLGLALRRVLNAPIPERRVRRVPDVMLTVASSRARADHRPPMQRKVPRLPPPTATPKRKRWLAPINALFAAFRGRPGVLARRRLRPREC
jgi:hypothetical protein